MKIDAIIQARMGSTRLPGKVLMPVLGKPLLLYQLERVRRSSILNDLIIGTTTDALDDPIESLCKDNGIAYFRGNERNVLDRYWKAAIKYKSEAIVRLTGDCPLMDPAVVDFVVQEFIKGEWDYASNVLNRTYPRGMDVEVFSFDTLKKMHRNALKESEKEHVTLYISHHLTQFKVKNVASKENLSQFRLTVDTQEDFNLIKSVIETLYPIDKEFSLEHIVNLLKNRPDLYSMNVHIEQKKVGS